MERDGESRRDPGRSRSPGPTAADGRRPPRRVVRTSARSAEGDARERAPIEGAPLSGDALGPGRQVSARARPGHRGSAGLGPGLAGRGSPAPTSSGSSRSCTLASVKVFAAQLVAVGVLVERLARPPRTPRGAARITSSSATPNEGYSSAPRIICRPRWRTRRLGRRRRRRSPRSAQASTALIPTSASRGAFAGKVALARASCVQAPTSRAAPSPPAAGAGPLALRRSDPAAAAGGGRGDRGRGRDHRRRVAGRATRLAATRHRPASTRRCRPRAGDVDAPGELRSGARRTAAGGAPSTMTSRRAPGRERRPSAAGLGSQRRARLRIQTIEPLPQALVRARPRRLEGTPAPVGPPSSASTCHRPDQAHRPGRRRAGRSARATASPGRCGSPCCARARARRSSTSRNVSEPSQRTPARRPSVSVEARRGHCPRPRGGPTASTRAPPTVAVCGRRASRSSPMLQGGRPSQPRRGSRSMPSRVRADPETRLTECGGRKYVTAPVPRSDCGNGRDDRMLSDQMRMKRALTYEAKRAQADGDNELGRRRLRPRSARDRRSSTCSSGRQATTRGPCARCCACTRACSSAQAASTSTRRDRGPVRCSPWTPPRSRSGAQGVASAACCGRWVDADELGQDEER